MTTPANHLRALLEAGLDDSFAIVPLSPGPVIPRGLMGLMLYRTGVDPLAGLMGNGHLRNNTFTLSVISPVAELGKAQADLNDALDAVLDVLETEPAVNWLTAVFEAYNDSLWCYTVTLTVLSTHIPVVPEDAPILDEEI